MTRLWPLRRLGRDRRGTSAVEFGMVAPVMLLLIMGSIQLAIDVYINAVLKGAMQEAGRDSGIEDYHASQAAVDAYVTKQVQSILPRATMSFTRKSYQTFSDIGKMEDYIDANKNGVRDSTECFYDENANNTFDDGATTGQGGARDVVVYTATVSYNELMPLKRMMGMNPARQLSATTTLMNQPFATQSPRPTTLVCP